MNNNDYEEIASMLMNLKVLYKHAELIPLEDRVLRELCYDVELMLNRATRLALKGFLDDTDTKLKSIE